MRLMPLTRESMPSSLLVTSDSMTRAELPGMENDTVSPGKVLEGDSLTGNSEASANPMSDRQTKVTISVKDDHIRGEVSFAINDNLARGTTDNTDVRVYTDSYLHMNDICHVELVETSHVAQR